MSKSLLSVVLLVIACVPAPPTPVLREVVPSTLESSLGGAVELRGDGFLPVGSLDFDLPARSTWSAPVSAVITNGNIRVILSGVRWVDGRVVQAMIPSLPPGTYGIELTLPRGTVVTLADAVSLVDEAIVVDGGLISPCDETTFLDADGDGRGQPGTEAQLCGPGRVESGDDCNDTDALTSPLGVEVCNGNDDDCDGTRDENVCDEDGGVTFTRIRTLDSMDNDFVSVSAFGPDSVWIAGGDKLFVHLPDAGFIDRSANCPPRMNVVFAEASGRAVVAGGNPGIGRIAMATPGAGCSPTVMLPDPVVAVRGFTSGDGGFVAEALLRDGRRVSWDGTGLTIANPNAALTLVGGHAASRATYYGVGRNAGNLNSVVRVRNDATLVFEPIAPAGPFTGSLRAAWAVSPTDVVVVGDDGAAIRRVGNAWSRVSDGGTADFTTVRAFAPGRFYVSTTTGSVRLWNGGWTTWPTDPLPIRSMDGVDEEHLWLVGDNGFILRGP